MKPKSKRLKNRNWDECPPYICPKCGYHRDSCVCKLQSPQPVMKAKIKKDLLIGITYQSDVTI